MQTAQATYLNTIERLLAESEIDQALDALMALDQATQAGIKNDVVMASGNYKEAARQFNRNIISFEEYNRFAAKARFALLELMKEIPKRLEQDAKVRSVETYLFSVPDEARLEKVLGERNNLLRISWLEKALKASRAVCRVVCADGNMGTGFLTREGYIFTNNHVLPDSGTAARARVEFNYELDPEGNVKTRCAYTLDPNDFTTSTPDKLDFARVRVIDRTDAPLSQWGYVEFAPEAIPVPGEAVTIIQHPLGEDKQIALNANDVISVWDRYLFYATDTEPGSSGSPVFNKDWKVVAIHHAGKTDAEGGLQINARGDRHGANRGILFDAIFRHLKGEQPAPLPSEPAPLQSHEGTAQPSPPSQLSPPSQPSPPSFVVLYDALDQQLCDRLNNHLFVLKNTKKIQVYNVNKGNFGKDTEERARDEMQNAAYVLVLITPNFFNEAAPWFGMAMEALAAGKRVIPVKMQKMNIEGTGLEKLRALPNQNLTVADYSNTEAAYAEIADEIARLVKL